MSHINDLYTLPKEIIIEHIIPEIEKTLIEKLDVMKAEKDHYKIMSQFSNGVKKHVCSITKCNNYAYSNVGQSYANMWVNSSQITCDVIVLHATEGWGVHHDNRIKNEGVFCQECWTWTCGDHYKESSIVNDDGEMYCGRKQCKDTHLLIDDSNE